MTYNITATKTIETGDKIVNVGTKLAPKFKIIRKGVDEYGKETRLTAKQVQKLIDANIITLIECERCVTNPNVDTNHYELTEVKEVETTKNTKTMTNTTKTFSKTTTFGQVKVYKIAIVNNEVEVSRKTGDENFTIIGYYPMSELEKGVKNLIENGYTEVKNTKAMNAKTITIKVMGRKLDVSLIKKVRDTYTVEYKGIQFEVKDLFIIK